MKNRPSFSTSEEDEIIDDECSGSTRWWISDPNSTSSSGPSPSERVLRELERLSAAGGGHNGLSELRHKLFTYRCGDFWVPTGGITKDSTEIPPIATILLLGFSGAGKSSLVNLMYSVLGRSCLIPFAQTSNSSGGKHGDNMNTTMFLVEHNVIRSLRSGFCVYDSRGFDYEQASEVIDVELSDWVNEGVHHNQLCMRAGDEYSLPRGELEALSARSSSSSKFARRRVNCTMVLVNAAEVHVALKAGNHKPLEAVKELYRSPVLKKWAENPMLILTHGDELSADERIEARIKICEGVGVSETSGVYDVVCKTEHGFAPEDADPVSAYSVAEALYRALVMSDRTHPPKRNYLDWVLVVLSWIMCFIAAVFAFLAEIFAKLGHRDGRLRL